MFLGARVVVVVPAFNEAARIARVVRTTPPIVDHVVVVDDASRDATAAEARAVGDPRVIVLAHVANRGVGAAICTGYRHALTLTTAPRDAFVVMAGDGQMDPRDLPALLAPIARGDADYVKGDRFREPAVDVAMPLARRVGGRIFSGLTSLAIGQRIADSQCGFTALSRAGCTALDLDDLYSGYGYPNDLLGQVAARGLRIAEAPVRAVYAGEVSRLKYRHLPRIAYLIARARLRRG